MVEAMCQCAACSAVASICTMCILTAVYQVGSLLCISPAPSCVRAWLVSPYSDCMWRPDASTAPHLSRPCSCAPPQGIWFAFCELAVPRAVCSHAPFSTPGIPQPLPGRCRGLPAGSPDRQNGHAALREQLLFNAAVQANSKGIMRKEKQQAHGLVCLHGESGSHKCLVQGPLSHLVMCTLQRRLLRHTCLTFWHLSWAAPTQLADSVQEAVSSEA